MANFNLNDYEPVEERIKKFYKDHVDGRIHTEMVFNDGKRVDFKAFIYVAEVLVATGYAEEEKGDGYVNTTSHVENCETSAIGRALANFNYSGDKRPSREEMAKVAKNDTTKSGGSKVTVINNVEDAQKYVDSKKCTCGTKNSFHKADCPMFRRPL